MDHLSKTRIGFIFYIFFKFFIKNNRFDFASVLSFNLKERYF